MQLLQSEGSFVSATSANLAQARNAAKQTLKALTKLQEQFGSYDDAVIAICIFGRGPESIENAINRCSVSAISRLTGIPRETVRRRTKALEANGLLVMEGKTYRIAPGQAEMLAAACDMLTRPATSGKGA